MASLQQPRDTFEAEFCYRFRVFSEDSKERLLKFLNQSMDNFVYRTEEYAPILTPHYIGKQLIAESIIYPVNVWSGDLLQRSFVRRVLQSVSDIEYDGCDFYSLGVKYERYY